MINIYAIRTIQTFLYNCFAFLEFKGFKYQIRYCEPNKRNNTRKREIRRVGKENTLFYQTQIDDNFLKKYISVTRFPTKYKLLFAYMHINNNC